LFVCFEINLSVILVWMSGKILPLSLNQARPLAKWFNAFVDEDSGVVENFHVTEEQEKSYIKSAMRDVQKGKLYSFVAVLDGSIVGKIDLKPFTRYIDNHVVEIGFGVLRKYPDLGISLISHAEKVARENNFEEAIYYILSSNVFFISLFEKAGFRQVGRLKNFYKREGWYEDRIILQKNL
jgi:RimJ/RimL family protein N-acetyltransferase